jgi:hypothetical protein
VAADPLRQSSVVRTTGSRGCGCRSRKVARGLTGIATHRANALSPLPASDQGGPKVAKGWFPFHYEPWMQPCGAGGGTGFDAYISELRERFAETILTLAEHAKGPRFLSVAQDEIQEARRDRSLDKRSRSCFNSQHSLAEVKVATFI